MVSLTNRLQNFNKSGNFWWQLKKVHQMIQKEQRKISEDQVMVIDLKEKVLFSCCVSFVNFGEAGFNKSD